MAARLRFGVSQRIIFRAGSFSNGVVRHEVRSFSVASKSGKERIKENPFFDKYRDKLKHIVSGDSGDNQSEKPEQMIKHDISTVSFTKPPSLKDVMHIEKLIDKTAEEVTEIWKKYHVEKDKVFAVIPSNVYDQLYRLSQECPLFVVPLPRSEGYEIMYSQFSGHRCYLTSLLLYKSYQENAPPCLTLTHYTDLMESKGIVLMSGELDIKMISVLDAQYLANQIQLYYVAGGEARREVLRQFNLSPETFDYTKLFQHLQTGINSGTN